MGVGPDRAHRRQRGALVGVVGVGVDEDDADGLAAALKEGQCRAARLVRVDRLADRPVGERALVHLDGEVARHHRAVAAPQPPGVGPVAPAHLQHVAEAARGDQPGARGLALEQRVGADGGAVDHRADRRRVADRGLDAAQEAAGDVVPDRRHLADAVPAGALVEPEHVGKGPADIDADQHAGTAGHGAKRSTAISSARLRACHRS